MAMAKDTKYRVVFKAEDVIPAQRMRFLQSTKFRIMAGLWAAAALYSAVQIMLPDLIPPIPYVAPGTVLGSALLFAMMAMAFYAFWPAMDFRRNQIWRTPFQMQVTADHMLLIIDGRAKGAIINWEKIRQVHETDRAYVVYTSSEDNFLILPKAVFPDPAAEGRFRSMLFTRSGLKPRDKERFAP
jgi:hypothetical protein